MLTIFILEDDILQQFRLEEAIRKVLESKSLKCKHIYIFNKPEQLLSSVVERGMHQLFFLDIKIGNEEEKGLEVAKLIREKDPHASIIFTTTYDKFLPVTFQYKVAALDFIDKSLEDEEYVKQIESDIETIVDQIGQGVLEDSFNFETSQALVQVPFHSILYFETSPTVHKVILHTKNERLEFYARLSQIEKADKRLFKCHKSFVVNPENIIKVDKKGGQVFFENNESCFVSKLRMRNLLERLKSDVS